MKAPDDALMTDEHGVLLRHWAGLQVRVSRQCDEQNRRCAALEAELMLLRARWVLATTQVSWGLGWPRLGPGPRTTRRTQPPADSASSPRRVAQAVICQTGCAGHAHPWREDDGQCRLTGAECERVPPGAQVLNP